MNSEMKSSKKGSLFRIFIIVLMLLIAGGAVAFRLWYSAAIEAEDSYLYVREYLTVNRLGMILFPVLEIFALEIYRFGKKLGSPNEPALGDIFSVILLILTAIFSAVGMLFGKNHLIYLFSILVAMLIFGYMFLLIGRLQRYGGVTEKRRLKLGKTFALIGAILVGILLLAYIALLLLLSSYRLLEEPLGILLTKDYPLTMMLLVGIILLAFVFTLVKDLILWVKRRIQKEKSAPAVICVFYSLFTLYAVGSIISHLSDAIKYAIRQAQLYETDLAFGLINGIFNGGFPCVYLALLFLSLRYFLFRPKQEKRTRLYLLPVICSCLYLSLDLVVTFNSSLVNRLFSWIVLGAYALYFVLNHAVVIIGAVCVVLDIVWFVRDRKKNRKEKIDDESTTTEPEESL